jgi:hypothetical protein
VDSNSPWTQHNRKLIFFLPLKSQLQLEETLVYLLLELALQNLRHCRLFPMALVRLLPLLNSLHSLHQVVLAVLHLVLQLLRLLVELPYLVVELTGAVQVLVLHRAHLEVVLVAFRVSRHFLEVVVQAHQCPVVVLDLLRLVHQEDFQELPEHRLVVTLRFSVAAHHQCHQDLVAAVLVLVSLLMLLLALQADLEVPKMAQEDFRELTHRMDLEVAVQRLALALPHQDFQEILEDPVLVVVQTQVLVVVQTQVLVVALGRALVQVLVVVQTQVLVVVAVQTDHFQLNHQHQAFLHQLLDRLLHHNKLVHSHFLAEPVLHQLRSNLQHLVTIFLA